jgi:hypothetical protein
MTEKTAVRFTRPYVGISDHSNVSTALTYIFSPSFSPRAE